MSSNIDSYISLTVLIDRVMRVPQMNDLPYDIAIDATVDTIRLIANPLFLINDAAYIDIMEYRGELPPDYVNILKVNRVNSYEDEISRTSMITNSDPYFSSYNSRTDFEEFLPNGYKIQGNYIFTNFKEGKLHIAYNKVPTDFDGVVMIPDRVSIVKAVEFSIISTWFYNKWMADKITRDKFEWAERQKEWYIGQTSQDFMLENMDKRKALSNIINTLILNEEHSTNDYRQLGSKEYRKRYI